jgi:methionyl-tRNA synthetase
MFINSQDLFAQHVWLAPVIAIVGFWTLTWKGLALYRAGANRNVAWFIVLLVVNTLGILEILYLFVFSTKLQKTQPQNTQPQKTLPPQV